MTPYSKIDQPEVISLLFPLKSQAVSPCPDNAEDIIFETEAEFLLNCRFFLADLEAPILFFYPATEMSTDSFDKVADKYLKQGMNVFLASYRGCGMNSGSPSVGWMFSDSEKLFQLASNWLKNKGCTGHFFVMGQSLGSVCAIDTVLNNSDAVKGLIIESGICDTVAFLEAKGASLGAEKISEAEGFNNIEKIEKIKNPTLIFHGARDELVAIAEAEKLQASSGARTKQFFIIPGAEHHTVSETGGDLYVQTIKQFTDTVCGVNTWRQKRRSYKRNQNG
ncbi:MAG: alpha/beta hydrolase [Desulfobulbaceae bacterium]|nr:alpha/beta hydrolase [Desulfobulbaceae bacterium]